MTELDDQPDDLRPVEIEALARVRHLGSGSATSRDVEETKQWGRKSAAHGQALTRASLLWDRLGPAGENLLRRSGEPMLTGWKPEAPQRLPSRRAMIIGGAAFAGAAGCYVIARPPLGLWPSLQDMLADYHTATGEQRKLTLSSGLQLTLNTKTSLNIRPQGNDIDHIEVVTGEVAIATEASQRKVIVIAGNGQIKAQQARFDVRRDGHVTNVACLAGKLDIVCRAKTLTVEAGREVAYTDQWLTLPSVVDPAQIAAWQDGLLIFHYTPLTDVVAEVNRYRPGHVFVLNAELGRRLVNGRVPHRQCRCDHDDVPGDFRRQIDTASW